MADDDNEKKPWERDYGTATEEEQAPWEKDYGVHAAPASVATEENLPGSTPRLRAAAGKTFQAPTRIEKETPKIPENYGFTPGNVLGSVAGGVKDILGSTAQGLYDVTLGEGKDASGEERHGLGGLIGLNAKGEFDPVGRLKWLGQKYITDPAEAEAQKSRELEAQGRQSESVGHGIASVIPLVGPWAAHLGERAGTGDVGGAAGEMAGTMAGGKMLEHPVETAKVPLKVADKVLRGTPLTEAGRLAAAEKQIQTVKPPRMSETDYAQKVSNTIPDMQRIAQDNRGQIKNPEDASDAITKRIGQMESPISTQLQTQPTTPVPVNDVVASADRHIDTAFKQNPSHFSDKEKVAARQEVLDLIGNNPDMSLFEMERVRRRLDSEASAYYRSKPADQRLIAKSEATAVTQRATANAMRDMLYGDAANPGLLEQAGIQAVDVDGRPVPIRDFRKRVGDLITVRDHFEDAITDAQKKGNWSAFQVAKSGPSLAAGGAGAVVGGFAHTIPGALFGLLLGEGAKIWTDYLRSKNPNLNTIKAFRNLANTSRPNTYDIQTTPLSAAPVPAAAAGQPAAAPITPRFIRQIPAQQPLGRVGRPQLPASAASLVPPETNIPPIVEPQFAREEVQPLATAGERAPESQLGTVGRQGIRTTPAAELPKKVPAHAIQDQIDELRLREKDLRKQGNAGAANAIAQRIARLEEQVPEGFEETPPERVGGPGRTGILGKIGQGVKRLAKEEEGSLNLGRIGDLAKKKVSAEEEGIPYTKPMPIPASALRGNPGQADLSTTSVLHHELAHAIVGSLDGFEHNGIVSHRSQYGERGMGAAALFKIKQFRDLAGNFKKDVLLEKGDKLADLFAAGAAINEIIDGIPRDKNPGLYGDRELARQLFKSYGFPEKEHGQLFNAAIDRAKKKLSKPGIADLIKDEATRREDNLPVEYHFSKNRVDHIISKVRSLGNEAVQSTATNAPAGSEGSYRGGEETVAGREGQGAGEYPPKATGEKLKPFKAPKTTYNFEVKFQDSAGRPYSEPRTISIQALDRKKAFKEIMDRKYLPEGVPRYAAEYRLIGEDVPEIGPPSKVEPVKFQSKEKGGEKEPSPLRSMVADKDAEARVNRKLNRKEGIGDPKSPALVVKDEEGKPFVFGNANTDQLVDKWQAHLDPDTIKTWREWYPDIGKQFEQAYGKGKQAASKMMAWLGSQQNTSPSGGLMNVERATDILSGQKKIKSAGIAENNILSMLQGRVPEGGYGAKLHDFVDSALGRKSRTVMGDDNRGGSPAVVDVHGARGMGFVDSTLKDFVEKKFGKEAADKLTADLSGAPTETQYEYGSEKMNRIADELNKRGFMGGGWTPDQVQAVDWAATIKQLGREPELPNSIFDKNTRRMSYEVNFGKDSPYAKRFPNLGDMEYQKSMGITRDVAQHAMKLIQKEAGGHVLRNVYGPGGWMESISPSAGTEILSSPEAAERATNMLGYLLQQDAVITSRPQLSGGGHFFEVREPNGGTTLTDPQQVTQFWNALREAYPKAEGFMPVETPDGAGIRILKMRGHFSAKDVAALQKASEIAADRVKMNEIKTSHGPADVYMASNDWKANPNGEGYTRRIKEIGRSGIQGRLRNELAPAVERAIQKAFRKHAPEQARGGAAPSTQAGKRLAAK